MCMLGVSFTQLFAVFSGVFRVAGMKLSGRVYFTPRCPNEGEIEGIMHAAGRK